ncbi:MAG: hypothetical protein ACXWJ6_07910, partial [Xanthobacteraceae bacterium]
MHRRRHLQVLVATLIGGVLATTTSFAQQPTRVRGTVEKIDGPTVTVKGGEAGEAKFSLADNVQIYGLVKA